MTETLGGGLTDIDGCVDVISAFRGPLHRRRKLPEPP